MPPKWRPQAPLPPKFRWWSIWNVEPQVFERICNVFLSARFVLLLIGIVPCTQSVRLSRRDKLDKIFSEIYARRIAFQKDPDSLKGATQELEKMRQTLWSRLERQDIVLEMRSTLYNDLKKFVNIFPAFLSRANSL